MKNKVFLLIIILGLGSLWITGCSGRMEKKVIGTWLIEDIEIKGDTTSLDAKQYQKAIEDQKDLRFELKPDSMISIYTGSSEITGHWYYLKRSKQFFVHLEGNTAPTPLGRLEGNKLVNRDTNEAGTIITTFFAKLEPVEKE
jgi:hypothetical protein